MGEARGRRWFLKTAAMAAPAVAAARPRRHHTTTAHAAPAIALGATVPVTVLNTGTFNNPGTGGGTGPVTHGDQLTVNSVAPWTLQGVAKGAETLGTLSGPSRGFWQFSTPDEFSSAAAWPSNANDANPSVLNNPALHSGTVTGSPVTIDGYTIPVGTRIVQFQVFPSGFDFFAQGTSLKVLFRGCRFRWTQGVGGSGLFNDNGSTTSQQIMMHYCDIGYTSLDPAPGETGLMHIKFLGGQGHRLLRNYHTRSSTFIQPNAQGVEVTECWIDEYIYAYGESGTSGGFDSTVLHLNGISSEGGLTSVKILRNHILCPSPDGATGSTGSAAGQIGYGTQPGQTGYGAGTNPGRLTTQTDCIALFSSNGLPNLGDAITGLQVKDNLLGGSGYCLYAGNSLGNCQNVIVTGNKVTTRFWSNGGNHGPITDVPAWGTSGNVTSGNTWADDYGTAAADGSTAIANRQFPAGDGPRAGTTVF